MGILTNISKSLGSGNNTSVDVDAFMNAAEAQKVDVMQQSADAYVKPIALKEEGDIKLVSDELMKKNLVLLSITPYARNPTRLKEAVTGLKKVVADINGDIARIDEDKILLTPANVKIVKKMGH